MEEFRRIKRLPPYVFSIVDALKIEARRRGEDIIDLGMGNPDIPTPKVIVDKLVEAVQAGTVDSLVAQNPEKMGYIATVTIVKVVKGETVEALVDTGAELVTADRLENDAAIRKLVGLE